jgi:hypothetical protein
LNCSQENKQSDSSTKKFYPMHCKLQNLPVAVEGPGTKMHMQTGWGGMAVAYNVMPGADSRPMLKGMPNDSCPAPHWGYLIKGSMKMIYDDGTEETISAGDVFYMPAGHNGISTEELEWIEFSPEKELQQVFAHLAKK